MLKLNKEQEKRLLRALRDDYYVNASLSYAAKRAEVIYRDALDHITEKGLPFSGDDDELGKKKVDEMIAKIT
ncbi:MAG: hypothetical protein ACE5J7_05285 [Candidatus Aenigmatarchaeota archaeon]